MNGIVGTSHSKSTVVGRSQDTAKMWVNFNGSVFALRDGFNVSSITDNGTGNYYVDLKDAMKTATDYCLTKYDNGFGAGWSNLISASRVQVYSVNLSQTAVDSGYVWVTIFGD